jgi:hypothetical protein
VGRVAQERFEDVGASLDVNGTPYRFFADFLFVAVAIVRGACRAEALREGGAVDVLAVRGLAADGAPLPVECDKRRVALSSCRCSAPITRPRDSADRSSSESSSRDRSCGFRAGSTFFCLVIPSSSRGPVAISLDGWSKERAKGHIRLKIEAKNARNDRASGTTLRCVQERRRLRTPRGVVGPRVHGAEAAHAVVAKPAEL